MRAKQDRRNQRDGHHRQRIHSKGKPEVTVHQGMQGARRSATRAIEVGQCVERTRWQNTAIHEWIGDKKNAAYEERADRQCDDRERIPGKDGKPGLP